MERITQNQLFILTVFFQIGTTLIFGFGAAAGKDAWIVTIVSSLLGLLAIVIYLILMNLNPGLTLVEWFPANLGKWIGTPLAWLYPLLFLYEAGRGLNDIKFIVQTIILPDMPFWAFIIPFLIVVGYGQLKGIEVIARIGEIIMPPLFILFILLCIAFFLSNMLHPENIQPILEDGWSPVLQASFPLGASQGFAQSLELSMIWPLVNTDIKKYGKKTIFATMTSSIIILISQLFIVTGLNEFSFKSEIYPMYYLIKKVQIGEFLQNLDVIGILFFIMTAFFKISLHLYFSIRAIQKLTKIESTTKIVIPIMFLGLYLGYSVSSNIQQHLMVAMITFPMTLWLPLLWVLPFLLLVITLIKKAAMKEKIV